jgi:hypothetical protein
MSATISRVIDRERAVRRGVNGGLIVDLWFHEKAATVVCRATL